MRANRNVSGVELRFRRALWAAGARGYRRGSKLPGRPDVAFTAIRIAVFVHGCYWHRCPLCSLPQPKANAEFWRQKFERNVERDHVAEVSLAEAGWKVVIVWEHELRANVHLAARRVAALVAAERAK
jgi:DNA mismatch endonuclease, patch repair protein